jgi:hypothetical protein
LTESSTLFDTVAIYLALPGPKAFAQLEELKINVTNDGMTSIDPRGRPMSVATNWKDLPGYEDWMTNLLVKSSR